MKTLQITILCAVLVLIGGCSAVGDKTSFDVISVVEASEQPAASLTASAPVTIVITETVPNPMPTQPSTPFPQTNKTPTITASPTPMATPTATATLTITPTPAPHVLADVRALNLRAGPATDFQIITSIPGGTRLHVLGRNEEGDWLLVEVGGRSGWVSAHYVGGVSSNQPIMATPDPPTTVSTLPPATSTPEITMAVVVSPTPTQHATIVLGADITWPVRAERISGWGYELVDASEQYDIVLQRDVYGIVAHEFWGDDLYGQHLHGIRITLIDPVWDDKSPIPLAPLPLFADQRILFEGFGDGEGAMIFVGCAIPYHHFFDPQECFIAITAAGEHLTDIVVASTITAENMNHAGYDARTPDFSQPPFHLLGEAYREGDQWRLRNPFLEVVPAR